MYRFPLEHGVPLVVRFGPRGPAGGQQDHVALVIVKGMPLAVELQVKLAFADDVDHPPRVGERDREGRRRGEEKDLLTSKVDASK